MTIVYEDLNTALSMGDSVRQEYKEAVVLVWREYGEDIWINEKEPEIEKIFGKRREYSFRKLSEIVSIKSKHIIKIWS